MQNGLNLFYKQGLKEYKVPTVVMMLMMFFRAVTLRNLVDGYQSFRGIYSGHRGNVSLQNIGNHLQDPTASQPRPQSVKILTARTAPYKEGLVLFCLIYKYKILICGSGTNKHIFIKSILCDKFTNQKPTFSLVSVPIIHTYVRFQVLTAASMKFRAVYWVVLPFTRQYNPEDSSELNTHIVFFLKRVRGVFT
jgi:hypothetical protein